MSYLPSAGIKKTLSLCVVRDALTQPCEILGTTETPSQ